MLRRTRWGGFATAAGLVAASTLLYVSPAAAAPGDADASGLTLDLGLTVMGAIDIGGVAEVGAVSGNATQSLTEVDVAGLVGADATVGAVDTTAVSGATGSSASSVIAGADVALLGGSILTVGAASAFANCPVGAAPTAGADLAGVTVLGQAVTVDADTPTVLTGLAIDLGILADVTADVTIEQVEEATAASAIATSLQLSISVDGTVAGLPLLSTDLGTITLAQASCERPLTAVSASALVPNDGPTVGGQTVEITGTGFTPETTVTFGGVGAEIVAIDPTGTAMTVVTPPNPAGLTTVDIVSAGGAVAAQYLYVESAITGMTPVQGTTDGGTTVTLTGQNLEDTAEVTFGGVPADIVSVATGEVVVTTPAGAVGPATVAIELTGGGVLNAPAAFVYVDTAVTGLAPSAGSELGGTTVRIDGAGLGTATAVEFGAVPATITSIAPDGTYVVVTAPAGTGDVAVTVTLDGGPTLTSPTPYSYLALDDRAADDLLPDTGSTLGGTTVIIEGEGLQDIVSVDFDGILAPITAVAADGTSVTVTTPAHGVGAVPVTLTFSGGEEILADELFDYVVTSVDSILPAAGSELGGTVVTLTGGGLDAATGVFFGGVPGTGLVVDPDGDTLTVTTPAGTGIVPVTVTVDGGPTIVVGAPYTYLALADREIDALAPQQGTTLGGTIVTITGDGLDDATGVFFGAAAGTVVGVSADGTSVQVATPVAAPGPVAVTLGFSGGETLTAATPYLYVDTTLDGITPVAGSVLGGTQVLITGTGLATAEAVTFGGVAGTVLAVASDGTSVAVSTPAGVGIVDVELVLAGGTVLTSPVDYEYLAAADRVIDGFEPVAGPSAGGTTIVLTGEGLNDITSVEFGGVAGTVVSVSPDGTEIVLVTPAHQAGPASLILGNTAGERFQAADPFVFVDVAVSGLTPAAGAEAGGTTVTIGGTGLGTAVSVEFGGVPAVIEDIAADGSAIVVTTPAGTGNVPVVIGFDGGTSVTAPAPYLYIDSDDRVIDDFDPDWGSVNGGTIKRIRGLFLHDATSVTYDGVEGEILSVSPDGTEIVVMTPEGDLGPAVVTVWFQDEPLTADDQFLYLAAVAPVIDTISPNSGPMTGGTTVVISGDGLRDATEVTFGGVPATIVDRTDDSLTVLSPFGPIGLVDIVITTPDGTVTAEDGFEFTLAAEVTTPTATDGTTGASSSQSGLASTGVQGGPISAIALIALLFGAALWRRGSARTAE